MSFQNVTFKFLQLESFKDMYFRNNCTNGIRSIRCFPKCSEPHSENGFCGLAVVIEMSLVKYDGDSDFLSNAVVVAEFKTADSPYTIASNVTGEYLSTNCKTKANPFAPFYFGRTMEKVECQLTDQTVLQSIQVNFNSDCKIFHYPWLGDRFTCKNINHVFAITVLMPSNDNDTFVPVHHFSSTPFKISSDKNDNPSEMPRYSGKRKMSASNIFDEIRPSEVTPEVTVSSTLPSTCSVNFCSPQRKKAPSITERLRNEVIGSVSPSNKRPKIFTAQNCLTKIIKLEESPCSDKLESFPSLSSSSDNFDSFPLSFRPALAPAPTVNIMKKDINKVILKRESNKLAKATFEKEMIKNPPNPFHTSESAHAHLLAAASTISPHISEDTSTSQQSSTALSTFIANAQQIFHMRNAALKSTESEASYIRRLNSFVEKSARSFLNMNTGVGGNSSSTSETTPPSCLISETHVVKSPHNNHQKAQKSVNNQKQDKKKSKGKSAKPKTTATATGATIAIKSMDTSFSLLQICFELTNQLMIKYFEYASPYVIGDHEATREEFRSHLSEAVNCFNISNAHLKVPKYSVTYRGELNRYLTDIIPLFFHQRFPLDDSFSHDTMTSSSSGSSNNNLIISDATYTSTSSYPLSFPAAAIPVSPISDAFQELMDERLSVLSSFSDLDDDFMSDKLMSISEDGLHVSLSFDFEDEEDDNTTHQTISTAVATTVVKDGYQEGEGNIQNKSRQYNENEDGYSQNINSIDCTFDESLKNIVSNDSQFFDSSTLSLDWEFYMQDVDQF